MIVYLISVRFGFIYAFVAFSDRFEFALNKKKFSQLKVRNNNKTQNNHTLLLVRTLLSLRILHSHVP